MEMNWKLDQQSLNSLAVLFTTEFLYHSLFYFWPLMTLEATEATGQKSVRNEMQQKSLEH